MKTLTEFPGMNLKSVSSTRQDLVSGGKTPEEITGLLAETLKMDAAKVGHLLNALDIVGTKFENLKRVVVFTLAEGEKSPTNAVQKDTHSYLVEYYPSLHSNKPEHAPGDKKGRRDGKRDGKRGKPQGDRPNKERGFNSDKPRSATPRSPRPPRQVAVPSGPTLPIVKNPVPPPKKVVIQPVGTKKPEEPAAS